MADREKVVSAIENCIGKPKCRDCPWGECDYEHETVDSVPYGLLQDTLELLKGQPDVKKFGGIMTVSKDIKFHNICPEIIYQLVAKKIIMIDSVELGDTTEYTWSIKAVQQ